MAEQLITKTQKCPALNNKNPDFIKFFRKLKQLKNPNLPPKVQSAPKWQIFQKHQYS